MTTSPVDFQQLADAIIDVECINPDMWASVAEHLTCNQVDALVGLFDQLGIDRHGRALYDYHCRHDVSEGDDDAYPHHLIDDGNDAVRRKRKAAEQYGYAVAYSVTPPIDERKAAELARALELEMIEQRR